MALPLSFSRTSWKLAMVTPASPSVERRAHEADHARHVCVGDGDHVLADFGVHGDALDLDEARLAVREHGACNRTRLPLGGNPQLYAAVIEPDLVRLDRRGLTWTTSRRLPLPRRAAKTGIPAFRRTCFHAGMQAVRRFRRLPQSPACSICVQAK